MSFRHCALLVALAILPAGADAQPAGAISSNAADTSWFSSLVLPGSTADDRRRVRQLTGEDSTAETLIRNSGTLTTLKLHPVDGVPVTVLPPVIAYSYNAALPFSLNDGSMWAGRGSALRITGGAAAVFGPVHAVFAPELTYAQNQAVPVVASGNPTLSAFASPWYSGAMFADLPLRFGSQSLRMLTTGQTRLEVRGRSIAGGFSSEDQWWGPGIRNALVLSNNAPGIPHLFLRTPRPLKTRVGDVEARWIAGWLTESIYFDEIAANNLRALSAFAVTLRPVAEPGLTIGLSRAVYAPASGAGSALRHFADVFARWDQTGDEARAIREGPSEQLLSLFGRWIFPANGVEVYGEWARQELPRSLRELLVAPHRSQAFTAGMQLARPAVGGTIRGQVEATTLEQTPTEPGIRPQSFYVSRLVTQGYTHRGQPVGAAIGPGSSSQWAAVDYLAGSWQIGANVSRIRWNEDAYYTQPTAVSRFAHDVSLMAGLRAGVTVRGVLFNADLVRTHRLNYLFQNRFGGINPDESFDVHSTALRFGAALAP